MSRPQIGPTTPGRCDCCKTDTQRWDLRLPMGVSKLCAGCLRVVGAVIKTELERPHMRGVAGDPRVPMPARRT